jgi:hypothetical protein
MSPKLAPTSLLPAHDTPSVGNGSTPSRESDSSLATSDSNMKTPARRPAGTGVEHIRARSADYISSDETFRPYRHLAMRVLARAVLDMTDPGGSATDRESARTFLSGSVMLQHWCRVAALNPICIAENVGRFTAGFATVSQRVQGPATCGKANGL